MSSIVVTGVHSEPERRHPPRDTDSKSQFCSTTTAHTLQAKKRMTTS